MKPKREIMARMRENRIAAGLVEVRLWVPAEAKARLVEFAKKITGQSKPKGGGMPKFAIGYADENGLARRVVIEAESQAEAVEEWENVIEARASEPLEFWQCVELSEASDWSPAARSFVETPADAWDKLQGGA